MKQVIITYIPTEKGWLHLAVVFDFFTRKVVGHSINESMPSELVLDALVIGLKCQGLPGVSNLITQTVRAVWVDSIVYHKPTATNYLDMN